MNVVISSIVSNERDKGNTRSVSVDWLADSGTAKARNEELKCYFQRLSSLFQLGSGSILLGTITAIHV